MKKKFKILFTKAQRVFQRGTVEILRSILNGRLSSKVGLINKELDQTVVKYKNKKGGYKILKKPIYYSGILSCLLVFVIFTSTSVGCVKPNDWIPSNGDSNDTNTTETIEFSEYSLTQCHWNKSNLIQDSVYIINSQNEFLTFISCETDIPLPFIDFSDQTLLFVYGQTPRGIESKMISLETTSNNYMFNVTIQCNDATIIDNYLVAIIVSAKITSNTIISLNKIINN
jgi:hypothetical protein